MGRRLVPAGAVAAMVAFALAAASGALVPDHPRLWGATLALVVLGGITPLIYTVNVRILPVFSRRSWQSPRMLAAAIISGIAGGWLVFAGRALASDFLAVAGSLLAFVGGLLFMLSIMTLFRSPVTSKVAPPLPFPEQAGIDRIGTRFTRLAGLYLMLGLGVGLMLSLWTPGRGRWDLVWAHTLLVGWFLTMASGVCYHVLPRWTGQRWRRPRLIAAHLRLVELGLPVMILALALDLRWLFFVAGPLQALALWLLIWNIAPLALKLPLISRVGLLGAASFLALGVSIGASMAVDPANHVSMRFSHAAINLFGWAGLLICGVGYYLFPRFAGQPLRWPRLAVAQMVAQASGVLLSAVAWWWYLEVDRAARALITGGSLLAGASLLTFALIVGLTFRGSGRVVSSSVTLQARRVTSPAATLSVNEPGIRRAG